MQKGFPRFHLKCMFVFCVEQRMYLMVRMFYISKLFSAENTQESDWNKNFIAHMFAINQCVSVLVC